MNNDEDDADDYGEDDGDDHVCHRLFYTNLSSVVRKLSSAAKAFLPHRSGGRRLGTGQTETNLLLKMLKVKIYFSSNISVSVFECLPTESKAFGGILWSINEIASFRPPMFASANSPHITSFSMLNQLTKFCLYLFETIFFGVFRLLVGHVR